MSENHEIEHVREREESAGKQSRQREKEKGRERRVGGEDDGTAGRALIWGPERVRDARRDI